MFMIIFMHVPMIMVIVIGIDYDHGQGHGHSHVNGDGNDFIVDHVLVSVIFSVNKAKEMIIYIEKEEKNTT